MKRPYLAAVRPHADKLPELAPPAFNPGGLYFAAGWVVGAVFVSAMWWLVTP